MTVDITGFCPDRFSAVRDAFAANFEDGGELGARFSWRSMARSSST
jgi:hypothetical protein